MTQKIKMTRQGVRDLSSIGSNKTLGRKVELPPAQFSCKHTRTESAESNNDMWKVCKDCGETLEWEASVW